jgi:LacI family transcriptional regulator
VLDGVSTGAGAANAREEQSPVAKLADVAALAGVSKATASKAMSDRYEVGAATRERVLLAARELNFTPNFLARGLGGGKTQTVAFVTDDFDGRFMPEIMAGAEDALGADSSSVIMSNSRGRADLEERRINDLLRRSVDGIIIASRSPERRPRVMLHAPVPVVYAYGFSADPADTSVIPDSYAGGRLAALHLFGDGRRRLACITGPQAELAAAERARGTIDAVIESGHDLVAGRPFYGDWTEQWGWDATSRLLDSGVQFDGVVCGDDQIARGVLDLLEFRGVRVPGDVEVIGHDNWRLLSEHSRRPFSSIDMNLHQIGQLAAELVTAPEGMRPGIHRVAPTVVVRGTTRAS